MSDKVRNKTKRIIIWSVIGAHVILLVIPAIVYALTQWLKPAKPVVHKIVLADSIPGGAPIPDGNSGGTPEQSEPDLPSPTDISDIPEMPQPKPQPPKPQPKPKPPKPVQKPKPKPKPLKPVQKPKPQPKPPKPVQKPKPKPKSRLTEDQIRSNIQKAPQRRPAVKTNQNPSRKPNPNPNPQKNIYSDIARDIRAGNSSGGSGSSSNAGAASSYYGTVGSYLERLWERDRPSSAALGGRHPVVVVRFRVSPSGAILYKRIERKCGIQSVDASVERLLARITALPQPPQGISEFTVNMRVEE